MSAFGPLAEVVRALDEAGIQHMVVGSVASSHYGAARATQDVDLLIDADASSLDGFLASVDHADLYVPDEDARMALRTNGMFNIVDYHSPWKIDLVLVGPQPFDRMQMGRRVRVAIGGMDLFVASPEDTILAKLRWHRLGGSDRQLSDVAGVLDVMGPELDDEYLNRWADELGVRDQLDDLRSRADGD